MPGLLFINTMYENTKEVMMPIKKPMMILVLSLIIIVLNVELLS